MFLVAAALTAAGAVVPGAVAIVVPIALGFAIQYGSNPLLMGLMVVNGATAGGFSPISVFGGIVNGVVERNDLAENAMLLFVSSFVFTLGLSATVFGIFGGRHLLERRVPVEPAAAAGAGSPRGGPPPVAGGSGSVAARAPPRRSPSTATRCSP
jgi:hypothetical protein